MKQIVPFFASVLLLAACNTQPKTDTVTTQQATPVTITADTTGLSQFQAWKTQHELANPSEYKAQSEAAATAAKPVRTSTAAHRVYNPPVQSGSVSSESANTAKAAEKRGWSKAAKGTAIGAGTGAVIGAVVNKKNRVVGGVVGAVAGGAVGYGIGRHMDKQDGRY